MDRFILSVSFKTAIIYTVNLNKSLSIDHYIILIFEIKICVSNRE